MKRKKCSNVCLELFMAVCSAFAFVCRVCFFLSFFPLQSWQPWRRRFSGTSEIDQFILANQAQKTSVNRDSPFLIMSLQIT